MQVSHCNYSLLFVLCFPNEKFDEPSGNSSENAGRAEAVPFVWPVTCWRALGDNTPPRVSGGKGTIGRSVKMK